MCYRCADCGTVVPPGKPMLRRIVYKRVPAPNKVKKDCTRTCTAKTLASLQGQTCLQIEREIPICGNCVPCKRKSTGITPLGPKSLKTLSLYWN